MEKIQNISRLIDSGLVAVIRKPKHDQIEDIAEALINGGVGALEITADTEKVFDMIEGLKGKYGSRVLVGAGTVLDAATARLAIEAGSDFIFSPNTDIETIQVTNRYGKISIPGVMTPTEMVTAYQAGADILKVFPADTLGVKYFKAVKGPLAHIPMMPTGGVDLTNVEQFIEAGVVAVGVGGTLLNKEVIANRQYDVLEETARKFSEAIQRAKGRSVFA